MKNSDKKDQYFKFFNKYHQQKNMMVFLDKSWIKILYLCSWSIFQFDRPTTIFVLFVYIVI